MLGGLGIGAAASVVGSIVQMIAARRANEEMNRAFRLEQSQQEGFRNQAFSGLERSLPGQGVEAARTQIGQGQQRRQQAYERINTAPLGIGGQGQTTRDKAQYSMRGEARGKLGGYSDWQLNQAINKIRTQDELNKISSFSGGQAQVFPYLMQDAQHSQDSLAGIGQLIASIGGSAGALGASSPWSNYTPRPQQSQISPAGAWANNIG